MPSASELDRLARRRLRAAVVASLVLLGVVGAALAGLLTLDSSTSGELASRGDGSPSLKAEPRVIPTQNVESDGDVRPRWTELPESGTVLGDRYRVGFPRTPAGAAAAAASLYQSIWTLDEAAATKAVQIYLTPADRAATREEAVQAVAWFRRQIGVDASAALPPESGLLVQPIGVQWTINDADNIVVSLAVHVEILPGHEQPMISSPAVVTVHMRWHGDVRGGDWLAVRTPAEHLPAPRYAEPGTSDFNLNGWLAIRPTQGE